MRWLLCWPSCAARPDPNPQNDREAHFNAEQNALVVKNAEHYYRHDGAGRPGFMERSRSAHDRNLGAETYPSGV